MVHDFELAANRHRVGSANKTSVTHFDDYENILVQVIMRLLYTHECKAWQSCLSPMLSCSGGSCRRAHAHHVTESGCDVYDAGHWAKDDHTI